MLGGIVEVGEAHDPRISQDTTGGRTVAWGNGSAAFDMKSGARESLLKGEWDALGQLLDGKDQVAALAGKLEYFKA